MSRARVSAGLPIPITVTGYRQRPGLLTSQRQGRSSTMMCRQDTGPKKRSDGLPPVASTPKPERIASAQTESSPVPRWRSSFTGPAIRCSLRSLWTRHRLVAVLRNGGPLEPFASGLAPETMHLRVPDPNSSTTFPERTPPTRRSARQQTTESSPVSPRVGSIPGGPVSRAEMVAFLQ